MELIRSGLGNDSDLSDRSEFRGVVGQVDLHFLERLDIVGQRTGLRVIHAVGESGSVDRPIVLIDAAAGEPRHAATGLPLQTW